MSSSQINNKRIAKNTLMLYIRMLLSVVVSLYTSRVVLEVLGVEDYGLYGLVGGVVSMFSFLNSTMAGATSRFLTFEMGRGDESRLKATFSSALMIHIGIALLVLLLSETLGLWFLNNKLVIPEGRMYAAHWVLQLSVLGMVVSFTQVPYNAAIIAHEKMDVYAYVELLHVFLKLGIVYLLSIGNFDKLIFYAFLVLLVNIFVAFTYRVYCIKNYNETRFSFVWDKGIITPMFVFSGWEALGHFGFTFRAQGVNFVLNMFFGVVINAVTGIATVVQSTLLAFSNNVILAVKPQIIKRYALGQYDEMSNLILSGIRFNLLFILIINIPFIFCTDYILGLWLKEVPVGCAIFCKLLIWSTVVSAISQLILAGIQATGKLKTTSIIRNVLYIATPLFINIIFLCWDTIPAVAYIVILVSQMLTAVADMFILKSFISIFNLRELSYILIKTLLIIVILCSMNMQILNLDYSDFIHLILVLFNTVIVLTISFYFFIFKDSEKKSIDKVIVNVFKRIY